MNDKARLIKDIIEYLTNVFNDQKIGAISQYFFKSIDQLNEILNAYFIRFKNKDELNKAVKFNLEELKKLSFQRSKNDFHIVKDRDIDNTPDHSIEWHNDYSHIIHSHLIEVFEERLSMSVNDVIVDFPDKPSVIKKIEFDSKMWNDSCFNLFNYLMENYYDNKKVDLISIWFFLYDLKSEEYVFRSTKNKYINFIKTQYEIKITNRDRSLNWDEKRKVLNGLYIDFKFEQKQHGNK